jgi:two-component system, response regulator
MNAQKSKHILLVEDNEDDVLLVERAMKKNHIVNEIRVARDGEEALEYLFHNGELQGKKMVNLPVVTLLDIKMPKVDGLEVLREIRGSEKTNLIPVVVLTSSSEQQDLIESYKLGANSYVRKPVDFDRFLEASKQLGLYWIVLNEPASV